MKLCCYRSLPVLLLLKLVLEVVGLEVFSLAQPVALKLESVDAFLCQVLSVGVCKVLHIFHRFLLTEVLALELSIHTVTSECRTHCGICDHL